MVNFTGHYIIQFLCSASHFCFFLLPLSPLLLFSSISNQTSVAPPPTTFAPPPAYFAIQARFYLVTAPVLPREAPRHACVAFLLPLVSSSRHLVSWWMLHRLYPTGSRKRRHHWSGFPNGCKLYRAEHHGCFCINGKLTETFGIVFSR